MPSDHATEVAPPSRRDDVATGLSDPCAARCSASTTAPSAEHAGLVEGTEARQVDHSSHGTDHVECGATIAAGTNTEANPASLDDEPSLAAAVHEGVSLHPPHPAWVNAFKLERDRPLAVVPGVFAQIEHIGRTAVPGLAAKPIIDVLAGLASLDGVDALVDRLCEQGDATSKEFSAALTDRRWLMRWKNGRRTHHLHLVVRGGKPWFDRHAFRDALRSDPALARRYGVLKAGLVAEHHADREAYTQAKAEFVRTVTQARRRHDALRPGYRGRRSGGAVADTHRVLAAHGYRQ